MAIDFPNSPATNDTYTVGGTTWKYDGEKWIIISSSLTGPQGPQGASIDLGQYLKVFPVTTSNYYIPAARGLASQWSTSTGWMATSPVYIHTAVTANQIICEVTSAATTGGVMRLGIYNADSNGLPSSLVLDAGTVASTSTGSKAITISQSLSAGLYYLAAVGQTAGCSLRSYAYWNIEAVPNYAIGQWANSGWGGFTQSGVTGALPSTFSAYSSSQTTTPTLVLRVQ